MFRGIARRSIVAGIVAATVLVAGAAFGDDSPIAEHLRHHGFNEFQIDATVANGWNVDGLTQMYGFADDPLGEPGVSEEDAAGVVPVSIGVELVRFTDPSLVPPPVGQVTVLDEKLLIPFGDGPMQPNVDYLWYWAEMKGKIDFDTPGVGLNIAWPSYFEGNDRWASAFAGDSWVGASHIPVLYNDAANPLEWIAEVFSVDGTSLDPYSGPGGLAWIEGSTLGFYAPASALGDFASSGLSGQVQLPVGYDDLGLSEYGYASDITLNPTSQFDPNAPRKVTVFPGNFSADGRDGGLEPFSAEGRFSMNVGLSPYVDVTGTQLLRDNEGGLWASLQTLEPWPIDDPAGHFLDEYFSMAVGVRISYGGMVGPTVIQEFHGGETSSLGFTESSEFTPSGLHLMSDGTLRLKLDYSFDDLAAETDIVTVSSFGAFWPDEAVDDGRQQAESVGDVPVAGIPVLDPSGNGDDLVAVYDFITRTQLLTAADLAPVSVPTTTAATSTTTAAGEDLTDEVVDASGLGVVSGSDTCWWCWGVGGGMLGLLLFILFFELKPSDRWNCWLPWFVVTFAWIPFLLAGLVFWQPTWWWVPLLAWFPVVGGYTWFWAQRRSWWKPWHLYVVAGYLAILAGAMIVVGSPEWGLLLNLFWLPWVGFYMQFRGMRQPWWRPEMALVVAAYVAWVFVWVAALTPWFAWWLPVAVIGVVAWWFVTQGLPRNTLLSPKWCWLLPFALLPFGIWWIPLWGDWWGAVLVAVLLATAGCSLRERFLPQR
jgi:hypothetical protein